MRCGVCTLIHSDREQYESFRLGFLVRIFQESSHGKHPILAHGDRLLLLAALDVAAQAPAITIEGASQVTGISAIISGTVNPRFTISGGELRPAIRSCRITVSNLAQSSLDSP